MAISCAAALRSHFCLVGLDSPSFATASKVFLDVVRREFAPSANVFMMHEPWAAQFLTDFTFFRS